MTTKNSVRDFPLILLCAGASTRMGSPKGLLWVEDQMYLLWQLQRFAIAGGRHAIVVLGAAYDEYCERLPFLAHSFDHEIACPDSNDLLQVRFIRHEQWRKGAFSSLQKAIEIYQQPTYRDSRGAFVCPIDTPSPKAGVWQMMAARFAEPVTVVKPVYKECGGHPVLIADRFMKRLGEIDPKDERARLDAQMRLLPADSIVRLPVSDPHILYNLNDEQKYLAWLAEVKGK